MFSCLVLRFVCGHYEFLYCRKVVYFNTKGQCLLSLHIRLLVKFESESGHPSAGKMEIFYRFFAHDEKANHLPCGGHVRTVRGIEPFDLYRFHFSSSPPICDLYSSGARNLIFGMFRWVSNFALTNLCLKFEPNLCMWVLRFILRAFLLPQKK
jgi:hypothetical protein